MSYFEQRIAEMKLTEKDYTLVLKKINQASEYITEEPTKILTEDKEGNINIKFYDIEGNLLQYYYEHERKTNPYTIETYIVKRLAPENIKEGLPKYLAPKGQPSHVFFSKNTIEAHKNKRKIKTLFLTEGVLKAIVFDKHTGLEIIGLQGIHNYKELFEEMSDLLQVCEVENIIMIYDGDCRNISEKHLQNNEKNLNERPSSFFQSALNLRNLFIDNNVNFYFCTIRTENLEGKPKGIDDLILLHYDKLEEIKKALVKLSHDKDYFYKFDITGSVAKVKDFLQLGSVKDFYEFHKTQIGRNTFKFYGTEYKWSYEKDKLEIVMPEAASRFIRVGDDYYEKINKPTIHGTFNSMIVRRMKSTIRDDYGEKIFKYIPKYTDFIVNPNHLDYQEIFHGFYNLYRPFTHTPQEGNFENIEKFLRHIFTERYELGLDYIQLLLQKPTQILPILCLVSEHNRTGKTMFAKFLNEIFKGNGIIIGNSEINSDFNGHLFGKLIIAIDESFIDKKLVIEKIKALATTTELALTKKGKDTVLIDFFGKIILLSNNVNNFISASDKDIRYWVEEIKEIPQEQVDVNIWDKIVKEIPAFIFFLQKRKMFVPFSEDRGYFATWRYRTPAFEKIVENSKPQAQKDLEVQLCEIFQKYRITELKYTLSEIHEMFFNKKIQFYYLREILQKHMNKRPSEKTERYKIPINITIGMNGENEIVYKESIGNCYTFFAKDFVADISNYIDLKDDLPF